MVEGGDELLTVPQLAAMWPYSESTIRRWIDAGELPGFQGGGKRGRRKVKRADAEAFEANGYQKVHSGETPLND